MTESFAMSKAKKPDQREEVAVTSNGHGVIGSTLRADAPPFKVPTDKLHDFNDMKLSAEPIDTIDRKNIGENIKTPTHASRQFGALKTPDREQMIADRHLRTSCSNDFVNRSPDAVTASSEGFSVPLDVVNQFFCGSPGFEEPRGYSRVMVRDPAHFHLPSSPRGQSSFVMQDAATSGGFRMMAPNALENRSMQHHGLSNSCLKMGMLLPSPLAIPPTPFQDCYMHQQREDYRVNYLPTVSGSRQSYHPTMVQQMQVRSPANYKQSCSPRERERHAGQPELESADGYIYQVHFKRAHRNFLLSPAAPRNIQPGDFVKVEADRGEDLGVVVSKVPAKDFEEFIPTAGYRGRGFSNGQGEKKYIYRFSTVEEKHLLLEKVKDEERALRVIRDKVQQRRLPMVILDAEYQFDRHKLIFFFEADRRIDFRELVSDLFSLYKTRIWMQQVDTSVLPDHEIRMEIARTAGFLPTSYSPEELDDLEDDLYRLPSPVPSPTSRQRMLHTPIRSLGVGNRAVVEDFPDLPFLHSPISAINGRGEMAARFSTSSAQSSVFASDDFMGMNTLRGRLQGSVSSSPMASPSPFGSYGSERHLPLSSIPDDLGLEAHERPVSPITLARQLANQSFSIVPTSHIFGGAEARDPRPDNLEGTMGPLLDGSWGFKDQD